MKYNKISFDDIRTKIEKLFPGSIIKKEFLDPSSIYYAAKSVGIELTYEKIDEWVLFEYGSEEHDEDDLVGFIFGTTDIQLGKIIIVTDECFREKQGYLVEQEDFLTFIKKTYPELLNMDFFQPLDTIFIFPDDKSIVAIHHEGYILKYKQPR